MNIDHFQSTAYSLSRKSCIHTSDILVGQKQKCWSKWTEEINVILLYITRNVPFYHLLDFLCFANMRSLYVMFSKNLRLYVQVLPYIAYLLYTNMQN